MTVKATEMDIQKSRIARAAVKYMNEFNVSVIPLRDDKRPSQSWEEFQQRKATDDEAKGWAAQNIGIVTGAISGIIVVDCESKEDANWFWRERGKANVIVKTPRGFHFYFKTPGCHVPNAQRLEQRYDIRGDGGYVVAPPSVVNGHRYEFAANFSMRDALELVTFDMRWRYPVGQEGPQPREGKVIRNGLSYIMRFRAVSGEAGHAATYKAACYLKESGMGEVDALAAMVEWNKTNCDPPWTTAELLHKIRAAYQGR